MVFNRIAEWNKMPHMLIGASLLRIAYGTVILYMYLVHYGQRRFIWGPDGIVPLEDSRSDAFIDWGFSLYHVHSSTLWFEIVFHLGIVATLWFISGYKGRLASAAFFIFVWSLFKRNGIILDGGHNIMIVLLVSLLFVNMTAYFSVDRYLQRRRNEPILVQSPPGFENLRLRNLIHNLAVLACIMQVSMMYFTSGMHKVMGELWQNGTAIYYILQVNEYTHPFFQQLISSSDFLIAMGSYGAVLVQVAYPFFIVNRWTKYVVMAGVIGMHTGIAIVMGLFTFSFIMIANQLLLLRDHEYQMIHRFMKRRLESIKTKFGRKKYGEHAPVREELVSAKAPAVIIFYDGWCPFCRKSMVRLQKWDWNKRLGFRSFREKEIVTRYYLDPVRAEKRMMTLENGKVREGIGSVLIIARKIPLLWVFIPFIWLSVVLGFGQRLYDFLASRRTVIPVGGCEGEVCEWQASNKDTAT